MLLNEFFSNPADGEQQIAQANNEQQPIEKDGRETEKDDNTTLKLSDMRKTRLTLAQLHKLRLMNDVRKLEQTQKIEAVKKQYAAPPSEDGGLPGM